MNDDHVFIDEEGIKWNRIFSKPNATVDSIYSIDPNNRQEFVDKTGKKSGKLGDIYQLSAELSEKRTEKEGIDKIKVKSWEKYEQKRYKTVHPDRKKQQLKEAIGKSKHFEIEN